MGNLKKQPLGSLEVPSLYRLQCKEKSYGTAQLYVARPFEELREALRRAGHLDIADFMFKKISGD